MRHDVGFELIGIAKSRLAHLTLVRTFAGVDTKVTTKIGDLNELSIAMAAAVDVKKLDLV